MRLTANDIINGVRSTPKTEVEQLKEEIKHLTDKVERQVLRLKQLAAEEMYETLWLALSMTFADREEAAAIKQEIKRVMAKARGE